MRKTVFSVALGITLLAAPQAYAAPNSLTLSPSQAAPGDPITLRAVCDKKEVAVRSDVLDEATLKGRPADLTASTTVKRNAKPGDYTVSIKCAGATIRAKLTVVASSAADDVLTTAALRPSASPGPGTFVLGGVALLITLGAGFFALRRLRHEN